MRAIVQIISGWTWSTGTFLSILAKITPILDDSISLIAGVVGIAGGIVFLLSAIIKRKREQVELEIKQIELQRLKEEQ